VATNLVTSQQTGATQFANALANSQSAVRSLLAGAGIRMPGGGTPGVGDAWDPSTFTAGEQLTPEKISSMTTGTSYGAQGAYSEAYQAGGNIAADQAMQSRSRGLGSGGLASQRQELALMQTNAGAANVTKNLIGGIAGAYGDVNSAYVTEQGRLAGAATGVADAVAGGSITNDAATPNTRPTIKDNEIQGAYRGTKQERITKMRALIAEKNLTPSQQKEVQRLLKQSGFKWDIPAS